MGGGYVRLRPEMPVARDYYVTLALHLLSRYIHGNAGAPYGYARRVDPGLKYAEFEI